MVGADDGKISGSGCKQEFISGGTKLDIGSEEFSHLGAFRIAAMGQPDMGWHNSNACQLPTQADKSGRERFDLVPIQVTTDADIAVGNTKVFANNTPQRYAFIGDRRVPGKLVQRIAQIVSRRGNIIEKSELAKVRRLRKMKSEEIILEFVGNKIQKSDLVTSAESQVRIPDLLKREIRFL